MGALVVSFLAGLVLEGLENHFPLDFRRVRNTGRTVLPAESGVFTCLRPLIQGHVTFAPFGTSLLAC